LGIAACVVALVVAVLQLSNREAQEAPAVSPSAPDATASAEPNLPPPGSIRIEVAGGRYSVLANQAGRIPLLRRLAEAAGFELVVHQVKRRRLTLQLRDVEIDDVLESVLDDVGYQLSFRFDEQRGANVLAQVAVGQAELGEKAAPRERAQKSRRKRITKALRERAAREAAVTPEERAARERERREQVERDLVDSRPDVRAAAVAELDLEADTRSLAALVQSDPHPMVRAAAAEQLAFGDESGVPTLLAALQDPDPSVVLAALDALEFVADADAIPSVAPLLQHPDPVVREAASSTIEYLE
jgi:hypothetical protein